MKVVMISMDRGILAEGSEVSERMREYGELVEELHIVVFNLAPQPKEKNQKRFTLAANVYVYPTNSLSKLRMLFDAFRIGKFIIPSLSDDILITSQDPFETGIVGYLLARRFKLPFQAQLHTDFLSPYYAALSWHNALRVEISSYLLRRTPSVRVVSERVKRSLVKELGIAEKKITVLPLFVPVEKYARGTLSPRPVPEAFEPFIERVLVAVGRLEAEKKVREAIHIFKAAAKDFPHAGLCIPGEGRQKQKLEQLVASLGLSDKVVFPGYITDLAPYYEHASVLLMLSEYEGYGMMLVEAASAGCPIVTTNVGLVGDVLTEDMISICPVGDTACLTEKLRQVLADPESKDRAARILPDAVRRSVSLSKKVYLEEYKKVWEWGLKKMKA